MTYRHRFRVSAPLDRVLAFHRRAESLRAVTPPLAPMTFLEPLPPELGEGDEMVFRMWAGPIPVRWRARIERMGSDGFDDVQLEGPFARWRHRHRFEAAGPGATWVIDEIEASLATRPDRWLIGLGMWSSLPLLFGYRGWKTRRLLERERE